MLFFPLLSNYDSYHLIPPLLQEATISGDMLYTQVNASSQQYEFTHSCHLNHKCQSTKYAIHTHRSSLIDLINDHQITFRRISQVWSGKPAI